MTALLTPLATWLLFGLLAVAAGRWLIDRIIATAPLERELTLLLPADCDLSARLLSGDPDIVAAAVTEAITLAELEADLKEGQP